MQRVHIVGVNPRTGTTLLAECMRLSFEIARSEEHEASMFRLRRCNGVYLTKSPQDLDHVRLRLALDPRFHVICMVRDPRDVVVSRHGKSSDAYWSRTSLGRFRERWALAKQLLDHPRFMVVKYEDLIARPDEVQRQIAERFGFLVSTGKFSAFHERGEISEESRLALNGIRPIDATNRAKWTGHLDRLQAQLTEHGAIDEELFALGYETDAGWMTRYDLVAGPATGRPGGPPGRSWRRRFASLATALLCAGYARLGVDIG